MSPAKKQRGRLTAKFMARIGLVKLESKLHGTRFVRWYILSYRLLAEVPTACPPQAGTQAGCRSSCCTRSSLRLLCVIIGAIIATGGLYALSGVGKFRRLPFLRTVLVVVTTTYLLRGLNIVIDIIFMNKHPELNSLHLVIFSLVAFCIGIIHLIGVMRLFKQGRTERITTQ
jgi:hypothetical protein